MTSGETQSAFCGTDLEFSVWNLFGLKEKDFGIRKSISHRWAENDHSTIELFGISGVSDSMCCLSCPGGTNWILHLFKGASRLSPHTAPFHCPQWSNLRVLTRKK
ncbi:hypothetical protein GPALN_005564 [Globodera pallida]|nr:hypothetical protein GPALN_005564 [Globodera pallida]